MQSVKKHFLPLTALMLLVLMQPSHQMISIVLAQGCNISGLAYRDYNQDGIQNTLEPAAAGMEVRAYNAGGIAIGTAATGANGQYALQIGDSQARIEFTVPASMSYLRYGRVWNGTKATQSTRVSFADCDTGATAFNMGVNNPGQ